MNILVWEQRLEQVFLLLGNRHVSLHIIQPSHVLVWRSGSHVSPFPPVSITRYYIMLFYFYFIFVLSRSEIRVILLSMVKLLKSIVGIIFLDTSNFILYSNNNKRQSNKLFYFYFKHSR